MILALEVELAQYCSGSYGLPMVHGPSLHGYDGPQLTYMGRNPHPFRNHILNKSAAGRGLSAEVRGNIEVHGKIGSVKLHVPLHTSN
jgi:hypothetical protein